MTDRPHIWVQHANPAHPIGLLRARNERPSARCRTPEKCDELAPLHVPP